MKSEHTETIMEMAAFGTTSQAVAEKCNISNTNACVILARLVKAKKLKRTGDRRHYRYEWAD